MTIQEAKNGEFLKTRLKPEHELGRYAIAVIENSVVVGNFARGKTGRFAKSISFFLRASNDISCKIEFKQVNE